MSSEILCYPTAARTDGKFLQRREYLLPAFTMMILLGFAMVAVLRHLLRANTACPKDAENGKENY